MNTTIDLPTLIERCEIHANKADDAGLYTTANTLWLAARALRAIEKDGDILVLDKRSGERVSPYADAITPDIPEGYDTIVGWLAKNNPRWLEDLPDYRDPRCTLAYGRELASGFNFEHQGEPPLWVPAPECFRGRLEEIRAWPVDLLVRRFGNGSR